MQIGSFCTNYNHWSDNITIRAYVQDIVVPYFKHTIADLRAADVTISPRPSHLESRYASSSSTAAGWRSSTAGGRTSTAGHACPRASD